MVDRTLVLLALVASGVARPVAADPIILGWAVGDAGTILRTSNGGKDWTAQTSNTKKLLYGVSGVSVVTPEPSSLSMMGLGTACLLMCAWRIRGALLAGHGWNTTP